MHQAVLNTTFETNRDCLHAESRAKILFLFAQKEFEAGAIRSLK
jgi:hypothetical protein